jgi:hypothetical protein
LSRRTPIADLYLGSLGTRKPPFGRGRFSQSAALLRAWRGCGASRGDALKRARVVSVGRYAMRGVAQPQELFTPKPGFILP